MFWRRNPMLGRPAGSGGAFTIAFQASAVANSNVITTPASVVDNDFGILVDVARRSASGTAPSAVTPTNWTNRHNTSGSGIGGDGVTYAARLMVHSKVLTTAEASGSVTGMNDDTEEKVMLVFRPSRALVGTAFATFSSQITNANPSSQTVSASGQPSPLIVIGIAAIPTDGTAAFSVASPAFDATVATADSDLLVGYKIYNSSPANHSLDQSDLGSLNVFASFWVSFS